MDTQLSTYRAEGVVRIPALLTEAESVELRANLQRYEQSVAPDVAAGDIVREPGGAIRNLWRMERYDGWFAEFGRRPGIVELIAALLDDQPELLAIETFNKAARQGSAVPPHQDNAYFCRIPADVLTVWIAVDPATAENGPVQYLPGTSGELLPHVASRIPGNSMVLADPPSTKDRNDVVSGILAPGDAMIHHCQTIHWSVPNTSDRPRRGLLLVYCARRAVVSPDLRARYDQAQEVFNKR
ncbi:MAG TPA: phytanoyl-CoA dioxygenase family protein [Mycobacteriales bacterium]|nr:phytanoyl-CoA dioxygenase family protein [Mycobacteriales bacterium]